MNERIKELAKPYLMYERFSRYGESTEEEYYDFLPEELDEFVKLIVRDAIRLIEEEMYEDFANYPKWYKTVEKIENCFRMKNDL